MQYFFFMLFGLSLLTINRTAFAGGTVKKQPGHQYPAEFVRDYNQECLQTSLNEGLTEPEAKNLCDCTINEFERQYSLEEFQQLTTASATDPEAETALIEVGQFCFEQILYEQ